MPKPKKKSDGPKLEPLPEGGIQELWARKEPLCDELEKVKRYFGKHPTIKHRLLTNTVC
jgi:hypothetical protein